MEHIKCIIPRISLAFSISNRTYTSKWQISSRFLCACICDCFEKLRSVARIELMMPRYNSFIYLFESVIVWSIYQAARDFGLALLALMGKDMVARLLRPDYFVHIKAAVTVRIVGLKTETKWKNDNIRVSTRLANANAPHQTSKQGNVLTLREQNSVAIRVFGNETGELILTLCGNPIFRFFNRMLHAIPIFIFVCLVLPGVLPESASYVCCLSRHFPSCERPF